MKRKYMTKTVLQNILTLIASTLSFALKSTGKPIIIPNNTIPWWCRSLLSRTIPHWFLQLLDQPWIIGAFLASLISMFLITIILYIKLIREQQRTNKYKIEINRLEQQADILHERYQQKREMIAHLTALVQNTQQTPTYHPATKTHDCVHCLHEKTNTKQSPLDQQDHSL